MKDSITPPKASNVVYDDTEVVVAANTEKADNGNSNSAVNNTKKTTTSSTATTSSTTTRTTRTTTRQPTQVVVRKGAGVVIAKLASVIGVLVQAGIIALFLLGAVQFYYRDITLLHAVNLIIKLFYINYGTVYRSLFGAAIAVAYFVILAFLIKWLVQSIKRSVVAVKNSAGSLIDILSEMNVNFNRCLLAFCAVMGLSVVSGLLASGDITTYAIIIMVAVGVMRLTKDILNFVLTGRHGWFGFVLGALKNLMLFFAVCVMIVYFNNQAAKNLIYGLQMMFNGNVFSGEGGAASSLYALYANIVEPAIWLSIAIIFLLVFVDLLLGSERSKYAMRSKLIAMIVLTLITVVLHLIFKVFVTSGAISFQTYMIISWLQAIRKTYIPLLLMQIALLIMFYLGKKSFMAY